MRKHRAVALIGSPVSLFDVGYVVELFDLLSHEAVRNRYSLELASLDSAPARVAGSAIALHGLKGRASLAEADTLIVPGYPVDISPSSDELDVVRHCYQRGARILSICTGAFLLASAGLLDGRRATTHWRYAELFRSRFPAVKLDPDILYADEGQIITAAGSAAGLDMMLHVIRSDEGVSVCNAVARRLNVSPHRDGGQSQFIPRPVPDISDDRIHRLVMWMRENCTRSLTISELADQVAMSPRTFYRRFRAVTGHTPYNWILRERIGIAMQLLEREGLTLDRIAYAAGFSSADALRTHFQQVVGIAPATYRQMYASRDREEETAQMPSASISPLRRVA